MKTCEQIASHIKPYSDRGILLPRTIGEIRANFDQWLLAMNPSQQLIGFAEFRHPAQGYAHDFAEIGSVVSLRPGAGKILLDMFETKRKTLQIAHGCAITKDLKTARNFFVARTNGVITDFPTWFDREKDDRYFVYWS